MAGKKNDIPEGNQQVLFKDGREQQAKSYARILYFILWFLVLALVGAMSYSESIDGGGSLAAGFQMLSQGKFFCWLRPSTWKDCLVWSAVYWVCIVLFEIYQQKYRHDAAGYEAGSAKWNDHVEKFNREKNEPFGDSGYFGSASVGKWGMPTDGPNLEEYKEESGRYKDSGKNLNNKKMPPVPGDPNMIESMSVRVSNADMKTHLNNNVFIVGGAGTGKSRFFIKPNILQMNGSYVVTDPSGELLRSLRNVLVAKGYIIKVFNLVDMKHSKRYNPFHYIEKGSSTDVSILVDCFMSNTTAPEQRSGDPFWDKSEKALLSALIFYLVDIADGSLQKFSTVLWMVQQGQLDENNASNFGRQRPKPKEQMSEEEQKAAEIEEKRQKAVDEAKEKFGFSSIDSPLDQLFAGLSKIETDTIDGKDGKKIQVLRVVPVETDRERHELQDRIEASLCLSNYKTFKLGGVKTLKSILISAAVRLNPFSTPEIQALTERDEVELESVGDKLTCFFAIIPQTNATFNFLISMLFSQMFEALYKKGATISNSRLNYHVRFLLDEFANVGKIPDFPMKISTCRKYNISTTIVLQSIAQIKTLYKDDFETIIANCDVSICLGTNEQTTAKYFSDKLGKATITSKSRSTQVGGKGGANMSFQQTGRELMLPDEIMTMPYDYCIVMINHEDPFYDMKYKLEEHPMFSLTGDSDEKNFYDITTDPEFSIEDKGSMQAEAGSSACEGEGSIDGDGEYEPMGLDEALEKLLVNDPEKDGYYLIHDVNADTKKNLTAKYREEAEKAMLDCYGKEWKTPFYDGGNMDLEYIPALITRLCNGNICDGKLKEMAIICKDVGSGYFGYIMAEDYPNSNIGQIIEKRGIGAIYHDKVDTEGVKKIYKLKPFSTEEREHIRTGCFKGHGAVMRKIKEVDDYYDEEEE